VIIHRLAWLFTTAFQSEHTDAVEVVFAWVESGAGIRSACFDKWLSEPRSCVSKIIG
jgi:hypothetical protein